MFLGNLKKLFKICIYWIRRNFLKFSKNISLQGLDNILEKFVNKFVFFMFRNHNLSMNRLKKLQISLGDFGRYFDNNFLMIPPTKNFIKKWSDAKCNIVNNFYSIILLNSKSLIWSFITCLLLLPSRYSMWDEKVQRGGGYVGCWRGPSFFLANRRNPQTLYVNRTDGSMTLLPTRDFRPFSYYRVTFLAL